MTDIKLPYNFDFRDYQKPFFNYMNKGGKRAVLVWNRRAGKDTSAWNFLISYAVENVGIYYYIFPTFAQGRKVIWDGMTMAGRRFLDFIPKELIKNINNQEMKLRLYNGSLIQIVGSDNYDAIMGTNPSGCIFSEYAMQNPNAWAYIRPILDANNGWAIFVFTPRGSNHAKDIFDMAKMPQNKDTWFCEKLTVDDTKVISKETLQRIRDEGTSEDMIQQEWFCSFTLGVRGSYYATYLEQCRNDERIGNVPYDKHKKVNTAWDLGYGDSTSIIFYQIVGQEIHIIDFYENHGKELAHYAKVLQDKPFLYDRHFAPHDADAHELGTGLSVREIGASMGLQFIILPTLRTSHEAGIESARGLFPRIWIDEKKCLHLIKALENYRCEYDESKQIYKPRPVHDRWSHAADSFRYMALAVKQYVDDYKSGPDDDWVDGMLDKYQPRF